MWPAGYILLQHSERLGRRGLAHEEWADRIPQTYRSSVLNMPARHGRVQEDMDCLANIKHYRSLIPMAQEKRKPIFELTSADGAIGNHSYAVKDAYKDFNSLAKTILTRLSS